MDRKIAAAVEELARGRTPAKAPGPEAFHALVGSLPEHEAVRAALFGLFAAEDAPPPPPPQLRALVRFAQSGWRTHEDPARASVVQDAMLSLTEPLTAMVPDLLGELRDPDPFVHGAAARDLETLTHYLGPVGPEDGSLGEALRGALADDCADVRVWAAGALANLQEDPETCVPALAELLGDPSRSVRVAAAEALGVFGEEAREAVPALAALLKGTDGRTAAAAATALASIGGSTAEVLDGLLHLVRGTEPELRHAGIRTLALLQVPSREAVETLRAAAEGDPDESIRGGAAQALRLLLQKHGSV